MPKNILVYYQSPLPSVFIESLVAEFVKKDNNVFFLTKSVRGILHDKAEASGARTAFYNPKGHRFFRFFFHWWFLIKYCRRNKIDTVYSHLQLANLIALCSRYFIRANVFPCRHHVNEVKIVNNKTAVQIDKMVNRLAKKIIVVSNASRKYMIEQEKVRPEKIVVIPLGYDFDLYDKPDESEVKRIREQMNCQLILIVIARMTSGKRHILALQLVEKLVKAGLDVKMLILGSGDEEENLKNYVQQNHLDKFVTFTGFLNNTMDYVAAANLLIVPSIIESSNQVVKEVSLHEKPCIACDGIGDFNEYIIHRQNSFLVSKDNTVDEMFDIIKEYYYKKEELSVMGRQLKKEVLARFDIRVIIEKYLELGN